MTLLRPDFRIQASLPTDRLKFGLHFPTNGDFKRSYLRFEGNEPLSEVRYIGFNNDFHLNFDFPIPCHKNLSFTIAPNNGDT